MGKATDRRYCRLANSAIVFSISERLKLRIGRDLYECDVKGGLLRHPLEAPPEDAAAAEKKAAAEAKKAEAAAEKAAAADKKKAGRK